MSFMEITQYLYTNNMAQRRMFSLQVVDTDAFLDMPQSAQLLYFHLSMRADDDGFVSNPKKIMRIIGVNDDDIKILLAKRFLLIFESGIIVIKHWKLNNWIQKDRYHETQYVDEKSQLLIKDNGVYTECIQNGYSGKVSIGKVSIGKEITEDLADASVAPQTFGNQEITSIIEEFKTKFNLPVLDGSIKENRQYANLLLKKAGGREKISELIYLGSTDEWLKNNLTSIKALYYNMVKILARKRGNKPVVAVMGGEGTN